MSPSRRSTRNDAGPLPAVPIAVTRAKRSTSVWYCDPA